MHLGKIANSLDCDKINFADVDIKGIQIDSRKVQKGDLYICISGYTVDGHIYAQSAVENGAVAIIVERQIEDIDIPQLLVKNSRRAFALSASLWYGNPTKDLKIIGITGTNGKTTTSHMLKTILDANNIKTATIGTIGTYIGDEIYSQNLTTPDPMELQEIFVLALDKQCEIVIMEVSAHALELKKVDGISFFASAFTNITQDHLDDFGTMEKYQKAKKKLFTNLSKRAIINIDDKFAYDIIAEHNGEVITFGVKNTDADFFATDINLSESGIEYIIHSKDKNINISIDMPGLFNVSNSLAAAALASILGLSLEDIAKGTNKIVNVDGRMERVEFDAPFHVFVDYAHTPDSLENLMTNIKVFCEGKCICVFGCGGDRDTSKRPIMGEIAGKYADFSILTSDNPRTEEPDSIIDMIEDGIKKTTNDYIRITDRKAAIYKALDIAKAKDIVVIAGKGHEKYQDVMGVKHHFDDREIVLEYMDKRG